MTRSSAGCPALRGVTKRLIGDLIGDLDGTQLSCETALENARQIDYFYQGPIP